MRMIGLSDAETVRLIEADRPETAKAEHSISDPNVGVKSNMAAPQRKLVRCIKIMLAISFLGTIFVLIRVHYMQTATDNDSGIFNMGSLFVPRVYKIDDAVKLKISDNSLAFTDSATGQFLTVKFTGGVINMTPDLDSCMKILGKADADHARKLKLGFDPFAKSVCLKWKDTVLVVNDTRVRGSRCYSVHWTTRESSSPENCALMSGAHWYGGSLLREQQWPLEEVSVPMQPFISSPLSVFHSPDGFQGDYGPVLERMWINSGGFGIIADGQEPLHVSVNAHQKARLCLKTRGYGGESTDRKDSPLTLKYTVCMDRTAKHVHEHMVKMFLRLPSSAPSERLMQDPVWSTRGININSLTQTQALDLKNDITKHNFLHSRVHIAGNVTSRVGGLFFDHERFPNAHQMVGEMKFEGFSVSTSVLPVMEKEVFHFKEGVEAGAFVDVVNGSKGLAAKWGDKTVALIDFTNPEACQWMTSCMTSFKAESSVSGFHFDSGEATLLPRSLLTTAVPLPNPCDYSRHYVQFASSFGNSSTVSVGYRSQEFPVMVDIGARRSDWGYDLGLKSIIPSVLTLGLLGYPFVVSGPVGGVPVDRFEPERNRFALPEEELYIRWLQLAVFLPGLEMSVGPWQYGEQTKDTAHALLKMRVERVVPVLQTAVKEFLHTAAPIIRPLWWMAADDEVAQRLDCEFLISNKILVAPVLDYGARRRDVYLPRVKDLQWKDVLHGGVYDGGQWLRGYAVDINEVATFVPVLSSQADYHLVHE